jgi:hypothetical protein
MVSNGRGMTMLAEEGKIVSRQRARNELLASLPPGRNTRSVVCPWQLLRELEK